MAFADRHAIPHAYLNLADLLAHPDIQCIYVGNHPRHHSQTVMAALAAGKHVLCEPPLALDLGRGAARQPHRAQPRPGTERQLPPPRRPGAFDRAGDDRRRGHRGRVGRHRDQRRPAADRVSDLAVGTAWRRRLVRPHAPQPGHAPLSAARRYRRDHGRRLATVAGNRRRGRRANRRHPAPFRGRRRDARFVPRPPCADKGRSPRQSRDAGRSSLLGR